MKLIEALKTIQGYTNLHSLVIQIYSDGSGSIAVTEFPSDPIPINKRELSWDSREDMHDVLGRAIDFIEGKERKFTL